jgi:hypothetical protein
MRLLLRTFIAATLVLAAGCNTFRVAGAPTFGKVHEISVADIEAAVAAYRKYTLATYHTEPSVGQIQVLSHDSVRIYWGEAGGSYTTFNRVHGRWRFGEEAVVTS